jgi:hypothetical protein
MIALTITVVTSIEEFFNSFWIFSVINLMDFGTIRNRTDILFEISGSHGREDVQCGLLGCDTEWSCRWLSLLQRKVLLTSSP